MYRIIYDANLVVVITSVDWRDFGNDHHLARLGPPAPSWHPVVFSRPSISRPCIIFDAISECPFQSQECWDFGERKVGTK
jgi:hypothetical protein